ncbi:MAG: OmpH family outer membrane protein, partial [Prevotella salivae]|nr:OmpH family outer membrane protein [Segatella salivae]
MNKKNILKTMALAAITTVAMTSCNQSAPKVDEKSDAAQPTPKGLKIAYV